jgi:UTP--glucose-1-phosphate uridylyltransferase
MKPITKAIVPAAGKGTRLTPFTKSLPKELMPLVNKPALQYIVDEGLQNGITEWNIVINNDKKAIKHYFSSTSCPQPNQLTKEIKKIINELRTIIEQCTFNFANQPNPRGLGDAILCAEEFINNEFFSIFLPDDIIDGRNTLKEMLSIAQDKQASVIAVCEVPQEKTSSYGIVDTIATNNKSLFNVNKLVEKPSPQDAPSNLAIIGRYVLSPKIFSFLHALERDPNKEIQLTDAIDALVQDGNPVYAYKINEPRFDIGNTTGWLNATIQLIKNNDQYASLLN